MKYSLIVAIVVLALAQGTLSDTPELEKATKFLEGVGDELVSTFQKTLETLQSQTLIEEGRAQLDPIITQFRENFAPLAASVQEQITPLAESLQEKIKPFVDDLQKKMEDLFRKLADQPRLG